MQFNPVSPTVMHIDLNACFASVEQQANPLLRGKPVAVAAYPTSNGCILAASYEAKRLGVKTGMRVKDGKLLCKDMIVLGPDPHKYRHVHRAFRKLLKEYTWDFNPKSIDEFVLHFDKTLPMHNKSMYEIGAEIKRRIKSDIGDYLTVSVGIGPNRFLAKTGANLTKPDGLDTIDRQTYEDVFKKLELTDLTGIKNRNAIRLMEMGIFNVWDFYEAPLWKLKAAFKSVNGYYWHLRLHGYEIDRVEFGRRSYGNSYALPKPFSEVPDLSPLLSKLVTKMSARVRAAKLRARGIHLSIWYRDGSVYHRGYTTSYDLWNTKDFYQAALVILHESPRKPVRNLAVSSFNLRTSFAVQGELFSDVEKGLALSTACDGVNKRFGTYTITAARVLPAKQNIPDRIAFGNVKELEEMMAS